MKYFLNIILAAAIGILGWQSVSLYQQYSALKKSSDKLSADISDIKKENQDMLSDIKYFSDPDNLEKELKSQTTYKDPGEKMIIIVPPNDSQNN